MVRTPAGYVAFEGRQRKIVALFCFMLSSAIVGSIMVYVDSYSMENWKSSNDVGPASLVARGSGIDYEINNFREIAGITKAASLRGRTSYLVSNTYGLTWLANTFGIESNEEFLEAFPTVFVLTEGHFPTNDSEVAISTLIAYRLYVGLGDQVNYSFSNMAPIVGSPQVAIVSGIFKHGESGYTNSLFYTRANAIFHTLEHDSSDSSYIYADVDRSRIVAYDPMGSLRFLNRIDEDIKRLDITYARGSDTSQYSVVNLLSDSIESYMTHLADLRTSQVFRAGGIVLLELAVIYLAINHIWNEREFETSMLIARGASRTRVNILVNTEITATAILSILPGFATGIVFSRFALASDGFFRIDFQKLLTEPLLITYDSLIFSIVAGIALPLLVLVMYHLKGLLRIPTIDVRGRVAKLTKALGFIKWDMVILSLSAAFLVAFNMEGTVITQNPFLFSLLDVLPYTLFFAMTSLALKGLKRGSIKLSNVCGIVVGEIPASVGIRRISRATASSGPLILVLVLAMSLGWNCAINDATLPYTRLNQSRFAIGGDLAFHLDTDKSAQWYSFIGNLTNSIPSSSGTLIDILSLSLSTGTEGLFDFIAINPEEYSRVGYDSVGNKLNESKLSPLIDQLSITEFGAIITQDIAEQYDLSNGGILRAFWRNATELEALEFSIIGVVGALPDTLTFESEYDSYYENPWTYKVGLGKVWVNIDDVDTILSEVQDIDTVFCMRVGNQSSATQTAEEFLNSGWMDVLKNQEWASAFREVEVYTGQDIYSLDRSTDTLMTVVSIGVIFGAFVVYAVEGIKSRKREIALLRSLGAEKNLIIKVQTSEMLVLLLVSVILLGLFTPILSVNSLLSAVRTYGGVSYIYPSPITILTPWLSMGIILSFFILCTIVFISLIALLSSRVDLNEALNSTWTESGPYTEGF